MSTRISTLIGAAALAATAISITGVVGAASTALADPPTMNGTYLVDVKDPGSPDWTDTWTLTPDGNGKAKWSNAQGTNGEATLENGKWEVNLDDTNTCGTDTKSYPVTTHWIWDPNSLSGTYFETFKIDQPCGKAGQNGPTQSFTLTKVG